MTRSKNVELRLIVIATDAAPPVSGTTPTVGALSEKVPSTPSFDTSSSFSWYESGSVDVFQLRLPRYWSASLTSAGVAFGRLAL